MTKIHTIIICIITITALWNITQVSAQDAKSYFIAMPDSLTLLSSVNRADCIDFMESNMKAEVTNRLGQKSEMKVLTESYIFIQNSPQSSWQMKVLPLNKKKSILCVITTVCAPACNSHIEFYTTDWKTLNSEKYIVQLPTIKDFLNIPADSASTTSYKDALRAADLTLLKIDLAPDKNSLSFMLSTTEYMKKEQAEKLSTHLKPIIMYQWEKKRFRLSTRHRK